MNTLTCIHCNRMCTCNGIEFFFFFADLGLLDRTAQHTWAYWGQTVPLCSMNPYLDERQVVIDIPFIKMIDASSAKTFCGSYMRLRACGAWSGNSTGVCHPCRLGRQWLMRTPAREDRPLTTCPSDFALTKPPCRIAHSCSCTAHTSRRSAQGWIHKVCK